MFSTSLDVEEVLPGTGGDQLHVMVADVIKSFGTVDRSILDCALGRLGLPDWFRRPYFSYLSQVRLRFKLAAGLGEPWCRDGGIHQGCPLCMVFIVAPYVPWCRHLESMPDVKPQLSADNLKCSAERPGPSLLLPGSLLWSSKMLLANVPAILNLLDGPVGIDPASILSGQGFA